ncbi:hypothetical protein JCM9279_001732 [Rhodotorula babjevae]
MSISKLPDELIEHIVRDAVEAGPLRWTYRTRYSTLRALALVCRRWRSIAQPILYDKVFARTRDRDDDDDETLNLVVRTLQARPDLARRVKQLDVYAAMSKSFGMCTPLEDVLDLVDDVEVVFLSRPGQLELRRLWSLPKLRELSIYGGALISGFGVPSSPSPPSSYSSRTSRSSSSPSSPYLVAYSLAHLSLCGVDIYTEAEAFLSVNALPSLRVFAHVFSSDRLRLANFPSSLRTVCNIPLRNHQPGTAEHTLYWCRFERAPRPALLGLDRMPADGDDNEPLWPDKVHHLRLTDIYTQNACSELIDWVEALPKLETLFVAAASLERDGDDAPLATLRAFCGARGVTLVEETELDHGHDWSSVVPLAWR